MQNNNIDIIENINDELRVSHRVIAEQVGIQQKNVVGLINKYMDDFLEFGTVPFQTEGVVNNGKGDQPKTYYLNEPQASLLITYFRNTDKVRKFKKTLIKEFFKMRNLLNSKSSNLSKLETRAKQIHIATNLTTDFRQSFQNIGITKPEELGITVNRAVKNETEIDFIKLAGKEGIETDTKFRTVTDLCEYIRSSSDFSDEIKLSVSTKKNDKPRPQNLNEILRDNGFQEKIDGDWKATEKGEKFSQFVQNKSKYSAKTVYHTVWKLGILREIF